MPYPGASGAGSTLLRMLLSSYVLGQKNSVVIGSDMSLTVPQFWHVMLCFILIPGSFSTITAFEVAG